VLESYIGNFSEAEIFRDGRNFLLNVRVVEICHDYRGYHQMLKFEAYK
jgi:hypothetical protein